MLQIDIRDWNVGGIRECMVIGYILQMSVTYLLTDERESWDAIASKKELFGWYHIILCRNTDRY